MSANSFRGNYSFLEVGVRQLFKGGNYSREETINFLVFCLHEETWIMVAVDQTTRFYYYWVTHNYNHEWILLFKQRFLQKKCHSLFWHYIYRVSTEIILFRERGWQRQSHNFHPGCIFLLFTLYQSLTTLLECGNYSRAETNQGRKL